MSFSRAVWPAPAATSERRTEAMGKVVAVVLFAVIVLQRFGLNLGSFSLSPALPAIYALLVVALLQRVLTVSVFRLVVYALCMAVALASMLLNEARTSYTSLLLIATMYLPFVFAISGDSLVNQRRAVDIFLGICTWCAVAGIVQFFVQFIVCPPWLFDFTSYLPTTLRGPTGFNTVIPVGSHFKSNGFVFREPSGFSFVMALALMLEYLSRRRVRQLVCFALALLLTYSGTGLLALVIGVLMPPSRRTATRALLLVALGALLFVVLDPFLNLSFTLGRLGEFNSERSSAYLRYIGPARMLGDTFLSDAWTPWLGHGPGTITRLRLNYEFHDPTWAKLLYEYGVVGFVLFSSLFVLTLRRSAMPLPSRIVLFFAWMVMGGHLLSPEQNFLTFTLVGLLPEGEWLPATEPRADHGADRGSDHALAGKQSFRPREGTS